MTTFPKFSRQMIEPSWRTQMLAEIEFLVVLAGIAASTAWSVELHRTWGIEGHIILGLICIGVSMHCIWHLRHAKRIDALWAPFGRMLSSSVPLSGYQPTIDERDLRLRERAFVKAYQVLFWAALLGHIYLWQALYGDWPYPQTKRGMLALGMCIFMFIGRLPRILLLWSDRPVPDR